MSRKAARSPFASFSKLTSTASNTIKPEQRLDFVLSLANATYMSQSSGHRSAYFLWAAGIGWDGDSYGSGSSHAWPLSEKKSSLCP